MVYKKGILALAAAATMIMALDNLEPTSVTPNGLDSMKVPLLISMGFDDNRYEDGVRWVVDTLLGGRLNPAGSGNKATFDGTPIRATFFVISNADQREAWREAYEYGCEIGNHTVTHEKAMYDESYESHIEELGGCSKYIVNTLGLPPAHIQGFRTPFLAYETGGRTFKVLKDLGMFYDCSVENGTQSSDIQWTRPYYPWTMDYQIPAIMGATPVEGLWQVPHVNFIKNSEMAARQKGFDSGLWPKSPGLNISGPEVLEYFKGTFDLHYGNRKIKYSWETDSTIAGNRAPMDIGLHSDYYSVVASDPNNPGHNPDYVGLTSDVYERRQALMDFVDYALSHSDVRFVTMGEVVRWMQNPVELSDVSQNDKFAFDTTLASPNLLKTAPISYALSTGSTMEIADDNNNGRITFNATVKDEGQYISRRAADCIIGLGENMSGVDGFTLTYTSDFPLRITFLQDGLSANEDSYYFSVPTSAGDTSVSIPLNGLHVRQPHYHQEQVALDLSKVTEIAVTPMVMDTTKSGSFTLDNLVLFGTDKFGNGIAVEEMYMQDELLTKSLVVTQDELQLAIPQAGEYEFVIHSITGKELYKEMIQSNKVGSIVISKEMLALSNGIYMVGFKGPDSAFMKKVRF